MKTDLRIQNAETGYWIYDGRIHKYLHQDGELYDSATSLKCKDGWYFTREEAELALRDYLSKNRIPKHGDVVQFRVCGCCIGFRILLNVNGQLGAYDDVGELMGLESYIRTAYREGIYTLIENIFERVNSYDEQ